MNKKEISPTNNKNIKHLKIAIAQLNFLVGDIDGNADRIIQESKKIVADLIVFPELALTGYPPEDLLFRPGFYKRCQRALHRIAEHIGKKSIIIGFPESNHKTHYNKAALIHNGKIIADYAKQELPNYTVFDEKRYFSAGDKSCVFELNNIKIGLVICEDLWHKNPIKQAKNDGAELIVSINASPYDRKKVRDRENTLKQRATENHIPIIYVNLIGGQDELVFDGGSMVVDADGNRCVQGKYYSEEILMVDVELKNKKIMIEPQKLPERLSQEFHIYETLKLGVRDYIRKNNFPGALVGLSGGIDSALTLAIAADAIGAEKVTAVIMPSQFTAKISIDDAIEEAKALDVAYHIIKIDELFAQFLKTLSPIFKNEQMILNQVDLHEKMRCEAQTSELPELTNESMRTAGESATKQIAFQVSPTEENLQARIRGMLLMALSNKFGKIVLTTGNKSEMSVGYATLYGDMAGGFSVIKDVPKTVVYKLAQYRNKINKIIPDRVITRAPTAELKENQTDQDKLPPYDVLDDILERYIEKDEEPTQIVNAGFNKKIVDDVVQMINANEYKRRQAPIGIRLTQRAFGKDRRYPITSGYARSKK